MNKNTSKNILTKVAIIIAIAILNTAANGQTTDSFDALLDAYIKSKINYKFSKDMQNFSVISYWMQQYNFYHSKITQLLNNADQAAQKNPRAFCLQALKMHSKYSEADMGVLLLDGMESPMGDLNRTDQLATYCSRYDIYYILVLYNSSSV